MDAESIQAAKARSGRIDMRFRHPLVLLLGGLLSASGIGCSAINAVVGDSRPAARQGRDTAGQLAAIARVFENQGRYSQAEVMYRKALEQKPNDAAIKNQLHKIAELKKGKSFVAAPVTAVVAQADGATPAGSPGSAKSAVAPADSRKQALVGSGTSVAKASGLISHSAATVVGSPWDSASSDVRQDDALEASSPINSTQSAAGHQRVADSVEFEIELMSPVTTAAGVVNSNAGHVENVSAETICQSPVLNTQTVTVEEILAVVETAADNSDLLLRALRYGDSLEAQCLAATLMGDCNTDNFAIKTALETVSHSAKDAYLRLAICDSRIQRNEHDASTAACLISLMENGPMDIRVQACSGLRHFAGSESQLACLKALESSLESDSPDLRAAAAVTLGDFEQLSPTVVTRLISIARSDSNSGAREAARAATARYEGRTPETAMTLTPLAE